MPTVHSHNVDIYYEAHGDGPCVLFAHGAGGNTLIWWRQVQHFAQRYRVITFDHRNFHRSVAEGDIYHPEFFADDARAILDAEGAERAALVCQSMGGWTGVQFARTSPERLACLVMSGTPGGIMTDGAIAGIFGSRDKAEAGVSLIEMVAAPDFPEREPAMAFLYEQLTALNPPRDTEKLMRLANIATPPDELGDWQTPTLFLSGEHDAFWSPEQIRTVHAVVPGSRFIEVPGSGHSPYFEMPDVFNRLVDEFLAEHYPA